MAAPVEGDADRFLVASLAVLLALVVAAAYLVGFDNLLVDGFALCEFLLSSCMIVLVIRSVRAFGFCGKAGACVFSASVVDAIAAVAVARSILAATVAMAVAWVFWDLARL